MDTIKEKLKSQNIVSTIFSFFHISKVLKITKLSKKYQEILSLHKNLFKITLYRQTCIRLAHYSRWLFLYLLL